MAKIPIELDEALEDIDAAVVGRFVKDLLAKARGSTMGEPYTFMRDCDLLRERGILPVEDELGMCCDEE